MPKRSIYFNLLFLLIHVVVHTSYSLESDFPDVQNSIELITDIIKGEDENLIVLSTLDGSLIGVDQTSGDIRWTLKNDPIVKVPAQWKNSQSTIFLPDPKDGSLYLLNIAETKILKKLPFSIQQLVATSPCRSSDGVFYTGKKLDTWFSLDWKTGQKLSSMSFDHQENTCPFSGSHSLFIGRTEYSIMIYDTTRGNRLWNITLYDYASRAMTPEELHNYGYIHLGGSGTGRVRTINRSPDANIMWDKDFGSPLVGLYLRRGQEIVSLPFSSLSDPTILQHTRTDSLMATLYIGEHKGSLYALPALASSDVNLLSSKARLMIEGPNNTDHLLIGHYRMPDTTKTQLLIGGRSDPVISIEKGQANNSRRNSLKKYEIPPEAAKETEHGISENRVLSIMVAALAVVVVSMFFYFRAQVRDIQESSRGSNNSDRGSYVEETQQGIVSVGKISFNTSCLLGKGCEGTFVFRGEFDGREAAVKRLLPDCFMVADREVTLLRESDAHPNVITYYCMEQDAQFRYIALELCSATLQDYVERGSHKQDISPIEALKQASSGLHHLHALNIVHRDIKPHNILLSERGGGVRAMISDFGLCKKLQNGKVSFSKRSGITGTDGWIAPEMIETSGRTMCAVDIFSMGCVFYYVLTSGKHPFGEPLRRQANILSGEYRLLALEDDLWKVLIEKMISYDPLERPPITVVLIHPVFWDKVMVLTFLQEASDRLEKEGSSGEVLNNFERGGIDVTGSDWRQNIHHELTSELSKYRSYRGDSLRDLLRALRNKKHHYRELSKEVQLVLGEGGNERYINYWLEKFPKLLYHTWTCLQELRLEPAFSHYYHITFVFPPVTNTALPDWLSQLPPPPSRSPSKQKSSVRRKRKEEKHNFIWNIPSS